MNRRLNLPNMQKVLMEFERQNERMEMTSDMMGDAIDDAMEVCGALPRDSPAAAHAINSMRCGGRCAAAARTRCVRQASAAHAARPAGRVATRHARLPCRVPRAQGEGEAEETDELVSQVLDEIGINLGSQVGGEACGCPGWTHKGSGRAGASLLGAQGALAEAGPERAVHARSLAACYPRPR